MAHNRQLVPGEGTPLSKCPENAETTGQSLNLVMGNDFQQDIICPNQFHITLDFYFLSKF